MSVKEYYELINDANDIIEKNKMVASAQASIDTDVTITILTPYNKYYLMVDPNKDRKVLRKTILQIKEMEEKLKKEN